jgi:FkbM family methyltransferase
LPKILKGRPDTIFDVGANTGEYAQQLSHEFPSAQVYSFEPVARNFEQLQKNVKGLKVRCSFTAVGAKEGTLKLYLGEDNADGAMATAHKHSLETVFDFVGKKIEDMEVPMTTLDKFCGSSVQSIDFLKIDVEGYELEVLKGASRLLNENRVKIIQFEFNEFNIFSRTFMIDFYEMLRGFTFYRVMPNGGLRAMGAYNSSLEIFRYQNILAVRNDLEYLP